MSDFGLIISRQDAPAQAFHLVISRPAKIVRQCLHLLWAPMTPTRQCLHLPWDIAIHRARQCLHLLWRQAYIPTRQALHCRWAIAAMQRQALHLWWAMAAVPRRCLHLRWGMLFPVRQCLHARWGGYVATRQCLHLRWRAAETIPTRRCLHLRWSATDRAIARQCLHLRWSGESLPVPPATVTIAGRPVSPVSISISEDMDQVAVTATLEFARPLPDAQTAPGAAVHINMWGMDYEMSAESYSRSRAFGEHAWTLTASSPAARLQSRFADPVEGELSGPASTIAARLAGDIPLQWDMVDWTVLPQRLTASGEAPLDLLRTLATAAGGAVTSLPDGRLRIAADPPYPPAEWPDHAGVVVDSLSAMIRISDNEDNREPYNAVTVSDEAAAGGELRIEEDAEARMGRITEALVYQVPWTGAFDLRHCGEAVVVLADLGPEERTITEEQISIVDGQGRTQYPVYGIITARWSAVNLGGVVPAESGDLTTTTPGESILYLTYRTRARRYRVDLGRDDAPPLMLVVED